MTATSVFLDLLSSDQWDNTLQVIRQEAATVFKTEDDWADLTSLNKLPFIDSAIAETMRKNPILLRSLMREVMPKQGIELPDGNHLPKGTWIGAPAYQVHHDDRFYSNANQYEPFRFVEKPRESTTQKTKEEPTAMAALNYQKPQRLAVTGNTYLGFGYGRHSW